MKLFVSTLVWTLPSAPGLMSLSNEDTVQPQEGRASEMIRSEPPEFLITKSVSMTWPLGTVPMSLVSWPISILGAATALPAAGAFGRLGAGDADAAGLDSAGFWAWATPATPADRSAANASRPIFRT